MSELKSAWEIALEKSNKLGKLSTEEEQRCLEEKYRQIGMAMVQRYLDDPRRQSLTSALKAYAEEEKTPIRRAALSGFIATMDLKNPAKINEICEAIASLDSDLQSVLDKIVRLEQEYEQAREEAKRELESKGRELLHRLRISGTAVGDINVEGSAEWQEKEQALVAIFTSRLDSLKREGCLQGNLS